MILFFNLLATFFLLSPEFTALKPLAFRASLKGLLINLPISYNHHLLNVTCPPEMLLNRGEQETAIWELWREVGPPRCDLLRISQKTLKFLPVAREFNLPL